MARYRAVVEFDESGLRTAEGMIIDGLENPDLVSIEEVEEVKDPNEEDEDDEEVAN